MRNTIIGRALRLYTDAVSTHVDTHLQQTTKYRLTIDANGNAILNVDNPEVQADIVKKMERLRTLHNSKNKDVA